MIRFQQVYERFALLILILGLQAASVSGQLQSSVMKAISDSSGPLCAADLATTVFQARSLTDCQRRCTATAATTSRCLVTNFYSDTRMCETYNFIPSTFTSSRKTCKGFQGYSDAELFKIQGTCRKIPNVSGLYSLYTIQGRKLKEVYCDMSVNGGGYAFIKPADLMQITQDEINAMFNDTSSFLMKVMYTDNTQKYGVLTQLPKFQNSPLVLKLNQVSAGYWTPYNAAVNYIGKNFLYFSFVPPSMTSSGTVLGLQVNGQQITFTNCDGNPSTYMALFPNTTGKTINGSWLWNNIGMLELIVGALQSSSVTLPTTHFMFYESQWGGCGLYLQVDSTHSYSGINGISIGFR